jgi:hypothetical protein
MAESCHKNIQKTEKWRAEKCLPHFVTDAAPRGAGLVAQLDVIPEESCSIRALCWITNKMLSA